MALQATSDVFAEHPSPAASALDAASLEAELVENRALIAALQRSLAEAETHNTCIESELHDAQQTLLQVSKFHRWRCVWCRIMLSW